MRDANGWLGLAFVGAWVAMVAPGCSSGGSDVPPADASMDEPDASGADADPGAPDADVALPDAAPGAPDAAPEGPSLVVFDDDFGAGVVYAPFGGSAGLPDVDTTEHHIGTASLAVKVPASGYVGGSLTLAAPVDLSAYDAVTFWAKASKSAALNVVGLGNDLGASAHQAEWNAVALTTEWKSYVVPLPLASALTAERGLFHFAEGAEEGAYTIWFDDVRYQKLPAGTLPAPQPAIATEQVTKLVGDSFALNGASVVWTIGGTPQQVAVSRRYFTFESSAPTIATVDEAGMVTAVAPGMATITAKLGDLAAVGALTVTVIEATAPTQAATTPTVPAADVIALFSGAYTGVAVDSWRTGWSNATLTETQVAGDDVKKYSGLVVAGVEFYAAAGAIDASAMTAFHLDLWSPDASVFRVKLVDFGANGAYGGGDDVEHELTFDAGSTPALVKNAWVSLEIPLASFTGLTTRAHLAQLILSSSNSTVFVDNVYLHR